MITKERLEELIKEEKGCYIFANAYTIGYIHLNKKYEPIIEVNENGYNLWIFTSNEFDFRDCIHDYSLFETKEDARWELEMTATRTETLKMPTWEEFIKIKHYSFLGNNYTFYNLYKRYNKLYLEFSFDDEYYHQSDKWDLTKENYIEACKLCLRLFKGEE